MTLRAAVEAELEGLSGWRVEMALALAAEVDEKGTASAAKELRSVLAELDIAPAAAGKKPKETGLSEFEQRLRERESASKTSRRAQA